MHEGAGIALIENRKGNRMCSLAKELGMRDCLGSAAGLTFLPAKLQSQLNLRHNHSSTLVFSSLKANTRVRLQSLSGSARPPLWHLSYNKDRTKTTWDGTRTGSCTFLHYPRVPNLLCLLDERIQQAKEQIEGSTRIFAFQKLLEHLRDPNCKPWLLAAGSVGLGGFARGTTHHLWALS
jgi:hypothetical protein